MCRYLWSHALVRSTTLRCHLSRCLDSPQGYAIRVVCRVVVDFGDSCAKRTPCSVQLREFPTLNRLQRSGLALALVCLGLLQFSGTGPTRSDPSLGPLAPRTCSRSAPTSPPALNFGVNCRRFLQGFFGISSFSDTAGLFQRIWNVYGTGQIHSKRPSGGL